MFRLIGKLALGTLGVGTVFVVGLGAGICSLAISLTDESERGEEIRKVFDEFKEKRKETTYNEKELTEKLKYLFEELSDKKKINNDEKV